MPLITFSEREASLNIEQLVANTTRPVLFTEGVSDAEIMRIAWDKLNPGTKCPFEIIQCFDCGHLRKQMNKAELYQAHPGRSFFGLFDFDKAYGEWAMVGGLKAHQVAAGNFEQPIVDLGLGHALINGWWLGRVDDSSSLKGAVDEPASVRVVGLRVVGDRAAAAEQAARSAAGG